MLLLGVASVSNWNILINSNFDNPVILSTRYKPTQSSLKTTITLSNQTNFILKVTEFSLCGHIMAKKLMHFYLANILHWQKSQSDEYFEIYGSYRYRDTKKAQPELWAAACIEFYEPTNKSMSSAASEKSKMFEFSRILPGFVDFGIVIYPFWTLHLSITCAAVRWYLASSKAQALIQFCYIRCSMHKI